MIKRFSSWSILGKYWKKNKKIEKIYKFRLAEQIKKDTAYSSKVASLYYKAPELILGNKRYDESIDIWALGATFASIVLFS